MDRPQPARRGARGRQSRVLCLLPRHSQRSGAQARYMRKPSYEVDAVAGTWEHGLAPTKGGLSLVQCHSTEYQVTKAGAVRGARVRQVRVLRLLPTDIQRSGAHALHAQAGSRSGRHSWHVGARPCTKKGRPLARAVPFHRAFSDRGRRSSRRAHAATARAAPPLQREAAQVRTSALHAQAGSRSGRRGWHVGAQPSSEEGRPLARAVPFHRGSSDRGQHGAARAGGDRTRCASSPETASAVAHKRATCANRLVKWTP